MVELSISTICVFALAPRNQMNKKKAIRTDSEALTPSKTGEETMTLMRDESYESGQTVQTFGLKGKYPVTSSMISGSTAASLMSH